MVRNINGEPVPVIIDFGLSIFSESIENIYKKCGTPGYLSPETINLNLLNPKFYTKSDMFALGVIFYYFLTKRSLFGDSVHQIIRNNLAMNFDLSATNDLINEEEFELLEGLLKVGTEERLSAS